MSVQFLCLVYLPAVWRVIVTYVIRAEILFKNHTAHNIHIIHFCGNILLLQAFLSLFASQHLRPMACLEAYVLQQQRTISSLGLHGLTCWVFGPSQAQKPSCCTASAWAAVPWGQGMCRMETKLTFDAWHMELVALACCPHFFVLQKASRGGRVRRRR